MSHLYIYAYAQALDSVGIGAVVTHQCQRWKIAYQLFPGRYGEWAGGSLSDEELDAVEREMIRWSATAAQQRLDFSSTLNTTFDMPDSNCVVPGNAAPSLQPAATSLAGAEAGEGSLAQAEAAVERLIPDQEDDEEQIRDRFLCTCQVMQQRLQILHWMVPGCNLHVSDLYVHANGASTPLTLAKAAGRCAMLAVNNVLASKVQAH